MRDRAGSMTNRLCAKVALGSALIAFAHFAPADAFPPQMNVLMTLGGDDKFQAAIDKFAADLVEKFHKARTPESEISAYCNEIADWLQSPLD